MQLQPKWMIWGHIRCTIWTNLFSMKLFLASEAKHPESLSALEKFVGGFHGKSIAYIPTASNGEAPYGDWRQNGGSWKIVNTLGAKVTSVVLEEFRNESVADELRDKDIIWIAGGSCGYLMYWLRRCKLDKQLPDILRKGTIYVGSSAGSMVTGPTLGVTDWYVGEEEYGASVIPGLGLVNFEIYPHYEDRHFDVVKMNWKKSINARKLYLLKNGEAVTVQDNSINTVGAHRVMA